MNQRIAKINSFLAREISAILKKELSLKPTVLVSVSHVETSADLQQSRIFISVLPFKESNYVLKTLKKEIFSLQGALNRKMATKIIPRLIFCLDEKLQKVSQIEEIFQKIKEEKDL